MSKQSGWMKRQDDRTEDLSIKVQLTTRQFMIDTLQMTLNEIEGMGYDKKKIKPIPFKDRYPYLKGIRYDIKYK